MGRRRDQPQISPNPNGSAWSNDTSKFGARILQQMGWQQGEGLGKHRSGPTEHLKIRHKVDVLGLGAVSDNSPFLEDGSSVYSTNTFLFNQVLQKLSVYRQQSSENGTENESAPQSDQSNKDPSTAPKNQDDKLHVGRNRVVYNKFIKAKNVRNYSHDDLSAIFGGTSSQPQSSESNQTDASDSTKSNGDSQSDVAAASDSVVSPPDLITNKTNINDYFEQRLRMMGFVRPQQQEPQSSSDHSPVSPPIQDQQTSSITTLGGNAVLNSTAEQNDDDDDDKEKIDESVASKKNKKRKHHDHDGDKKSKHKEKSSKKHRHHGKSDTTSSNDNEKDSRSHKRHKRE